MVILLPKDYWSSRCTLTWDYNRQHLNCLHNTCLMHTWKWCLVSLWAFLLSLGSWNQWGAVPSLFDLTPPQCFPGSCPPPPKAWISSTPSRTHLPFECVPLDIFAACFATLYLSDFGSHKFSCVPFVQLYHNSALAPGGLCIIYVLNWAASQNASALLLFVLLAKLKCEKVFLCCCAGVTQSCSGRRQAACLRETAASALTGLSQDKRKKNPNNLA